MTLTKSVHWNMETHLELSLHINQNFNIREIYIRKLKNTLTKLSSQFFKLIIYSYGYNIYLNMISYLINF